MCCRDPNYVDPWPNMKGGNKNMNNGGNGNGNISPRRNQQNGNGNLGVQPARNQQNNGNGMLYRKILFWSAVCLHYCLFVYFSVQQQNDPWPTQQQQQPQQQLTRRNNGGYGR